MKRFGVIKQGIILFLFLIPSFAFTQSIKDLIQPLQLISGEEKEFLISDIFFSDNYNLRFESNSHLKPKYSLASHTLKLQPDSNFVGVTLLKFNLANKQYSIPVYCKKENKVRFKLKSEKAYKRVSVFGSFNDWNRNQFFMKKNVAGSFAVDIPLPPGVYQYKFYADGTELTDPVNPDSISNGMGGYNSLLTVVSPDSTKEFLAVKGFRRLDSKVEFNFYFDSQLGIKPNKENVFALIENKEISRKLNFDNQNIILTLPHSMLNGFKRIRLVVDYGAGISNMQTLFLMNGDPINKREMKKNWHSAIIYSLLIDRFFDGDKSNSVPIVHDSLAKKANYMGGDFSGIIKKLNSGYFDSLGINTIWISPVYDNPNVPFREFPKPHRWFTGYHGYWPINSFGVDEHFGTIAQLKEIVKIAHRHGIKILLDFVSHHVHKLNPIFLKHRNWFGTLYLPDGTLNIRQWDSHRLTTWFEPYLPSFDFIHSDSAAIFMVNNALWWLRITGADGFRHDAVKHVPNKFWRKLTATLKESKFDNLYQIGETFGSYNLVSSYVNNGQLNAQFNFNLYDVAQSVFIDSTESFVSLNNELHKTFSVYGVNNLMGNIMDSHDKNRYMAYADGDLSLEQWDATEIGWENPPEVNHSSSYKKAELYLSYMLSIPGVPVIYYGSEFGMTGASDPDNRRMMRFGNQLNNNEKRMLNKVKKLIKLRRNHTSLNFGDFLPLLTRKDVYAYLRSDLNERVLVILNKNSSEKKEVVVNFPNYINAVEAVELQNGKRLEIKNGKLVIKIKPIESKFYLIK